MIDFAAALDPTSTSEPGVSAETPPLPSPPAAHPKAESDSLRQGRMGMKELERLGDEIARLSAHIQAATFRLLQMIRVFDAREGWYEQGFKSCATWLSWRTGVGPGAAREKVRVARALGELPELSEALRTAELSYSAARALTRIATPENEADLVEVARHTTAAQLEKLIRAWRAADRAEEAMTSAEAERIRHAQRSLRLVPDPDGSWRISGRLDPEVGAVLWRALQAAVETLPEDAGAEAERPAEARRSDALGLLAEAALREGLGTDPEEEADDNTESEAPPVAVVGRAERFQVVVHVPAETLSGRAADESGSAEARGNVSAETPRIADGPHVSAETARRLACDAGQVVMTHDAEGNVLDVGRRTRTVPPAMRRALDHRDGGCRFPGCGSRFCDAHHVVPWSEGGETRLDNLVLLCRHHHRRVHEDGWRVELVEGGDGGSSNGDGSNEEVRFHRPDGRRLPEVPGRPPAPMDPARSLERRQRGLAIDPWRPTTRWTGERLDVDWALFTLWRPAEGVSAETPAET